MPKPFEKSYSNKAIENIDMDFLSVECLEKLGLEQNPFIDHARDPFLFVDKQLEMSMNVLIDYLSNQNSTIVLLGEVGIGKTTHLRMLLRKGYQQFNFCTLRAKQKTSLADIEKKIRERWRLPKILDENISHTEQEIKDDLSLSEHIKKYIEVDKYPVLIIDDAHRLQNGILDELLKLKHHVGLQSTRAMGLVFAAEPSIQTQLAELEQTNPAATQIYQVNVRSFDASQCEEYLSYRLEQAGSTKEDLFNTAKITEIYTKSKGLPKHINKLAREELSQLCDQPSASTATVSKIQSSPGMRLGLILAGLIGLAVILSAVFKTSNQQDEPVELAITKQEQEQEQEQEQSKVVAEKENSKPKEIDLAKEEKKPISKPYVAPLVLGPLVEEPTKTETQEPVEEKKAKADKVKTKPKDVPQEKTVSNYSSDWIIKQDPNAYTIQLVASPNEENLLDFIKNNALKDNTAYYKKSSADKTWYVLVHGIYSSKGEAAKGIEQLSETLKKNTPYPIQIKYLQELINKQ